MRSLFEISSVVLCVVALGLIGFGAASTSGPRPGLEVDAASKSFGEAPVGTHVAVPFRFTNPTGKPLHVLGGSQRCVRGGCLKAIGLPVTILPHESVDVVLGFEAVGTIDYRAEIVVYTDCPGLLTIPLEVTGVIRPEPVAKSAS